MKTKILVVDGEKGFDVYEMELADMVCCVKWDVTTTLQEDLKRVGKKVRSGSLTPTLENFHVLIKDKQRALGLIYKNLTLVDFDRLYVINSTQKHPSKLKASDVLVRYFNISWDGKVKIASKNLIVDYKQVTLSEIERVVRVFDSYDVKTLKQYIYMGVPMIIKSESSSYQSGYYEDGKRLTRAMS
jgi:hypothetical protein